MVTNKNKAEKIRQITESIIGLPTLPTVVSKMLQLVDNPKTSAASLSRLISTDQTLTARILKLANSAYYGFSGEISTVNMAIVVLGFNTVKDMGLSLSVFDAFKKLEPISDFDVVRFWEHSIAVGIAAKMLARDYCQRYLAEAFVAGLLHDIGKVILNQYFHKDFDEIVKLFAQSMEFYDAEEQVIGTNHGRIGAWLTEKWNLPKIISMAILYHHSPWDAREGQNLVSIICYANYICHAAGFGYSGRKKPSKPDSKLWDLFNLHSIPLEESDIEETITAFLIEFDKSDGFVTSLQ